MAFNFFGTFSTGQFEQLKLFAKTQERELADRRKWLSAQLFRNGLFITNYDEQTMMPVSFTATDGSYSAKLLLAYKSLGGNPEQDFLLRTKENPVYLTRGNNLSTSSMGNPTDGYSDVFSNGRRIRGSQRFDRDIGIQVDRLKYWQLEVIKRKREHLEFKIKRALDYSDQLQREIELIDVLLQEDSGKTIDDLINKIEFYMFRTGAHNIVDDMLDLFGLRIGRIKDPTSTYDQEASDGEGMR